MNSFGLKNVTRSIHAGRHHESDVKASHENGRGAGGTVGKEGLEEVIEDEALLHARQTLPQFGYSGARRGDAGARGAAFFFRTIIDASGSILLRLNSSFNSCTARVKSDSARFG